MTAQDETLSPSPGPFDECRPDAACAPLALADCYRAIRAETEALAAPLSPEDQAIQSMPDASPAKWHRAHTTWFFETVLLKRFAADYREFDSSFASLFNSYYVSLGARHPRAERGLIARPSAAEIGDYRVHVDAAMMALLESTTLGREPAIAALAELGLHHEEQHQELLLTDILHAFAQNPRHPAYHSHLPSLLRGAPPMEFVPIDGGEVFLGYDGEDFAFDNERPRHKVFLEPYRIADRPVTNAEWLEFMEAGGYRHPLLWLSDGWQRVHDENWRAPLYWLQVEGVWHSMTLSGLRPLDLHAPVCHVSYYEADAFARWRGKRLPTEGEWEHATAAARVRKGNLRGSRYLRPLAARGAETPLRQMIGDVWEWTASAYAPYPGFRPLSGAVGEYNGKFMINQMVLRGGSCVTPDDHIRPTYRNFFYPHQRWQFSGVRLAEDTPKSSRHTSAPRDAAFLRAVHEGLSAEAKRLPCKYFYDSEGSRLFDEICRLPEYYPTRTELTLLRALAPQLAEQIADSTALVEFGAGSEMKACVLIESVRRLSAYVPIDISGKHLQDVAARVAAKYRRLKVIPIAGDFTKDVVLPASVRGGPLLGFFPGSTIGNFEPAGAVNLLRAIRRVLNEGASLLIGVDLVKDEKTLLAAYDDASGVTAAFNKNILARINRELGANIDLTAFSHRALWNAERNRIEMHLVSMRDQTIIAGGRDFALKTGETIHTESSHKYTIEGFSELTRVAGWTVKKVWKGEAPEFAVMLLR